MTLLSGNAGDCSLNPVCSIAGSIPAGSFFQSNERPIMKHFHTTALIAVWLAGMLALFVSMITWGWPTTILIVLKAAGLISPLVVFVASFFN